MGQEDCPFVRVGVAFGSGLILFRLLFLLLLAGPATVASAAIDLRDAACVAAAPGGSDPLRLDYRCVAPVQNPGGTLWLRASAASVAALPPRFDILVSRTRLARLALVVVRADGSVQQQSIESRGASFNDVALGGQFHFSVGGAPSPVTAIYVGFDRLLIFTGRQRIDLLSPAEFHAMHDKWLVLLGLFVGGIGASLIGSLFFYRATRSESHLWYATWAVTILIYGIVHSNFLYFFQFTIDSNVVSRASLMLTAIAAALGTVFFTSYIEPRILSRSYVAGIGVFAVAGVTAGLALVLDTGPFVPALGHVLSSLLVAQLVLILAGIVIAMRRGSRAVRFYVIAWVAPLAAILASIGAFYFNFESHHAIDDLTFVALTLQSVLLFVGHADRFAILRSEHRVAVTEQAILRRLSEVVFQLSNDGRWTFLNPAWEDLSGERVEETLGKQFSDYLHPDDLEPVMAGAAALRRGEIAEYRGLPRYVGKDGSIRWVSLRVHLRLDENGVVIGTGGSLHDITARYLSQTALVASERRHRAMTEISIAGMYECDADWNLIYANPAFRRISGMTEENAHGDRWLDALRPDYRAAMDEARRQLPVEAQTSTQLYTLCFVHPDGSERWASSGLTPIFDDDGHTGGYAGVTLDITDEHLAREALTASETRFEALARLSPAVIFRTDPLGYCTFTNAAWRTLTGRSPADALAFGYLDAFDESNVDRVTRDWRTLTESNGSDSFEYRFRHSDGGLRWTTITTAREVDADGELTGFVGVISDITAQKTLEHALNAARAAAEHAATTDELTGLPNRRQFMARLDAEVARGGDAPALAIIDVDHFKRINDTLGHPFGDDVLCAVGGVLQAATRAGDLVGRVGGEEFALMMPGTDIVAAQAICERIRTAIAENRCGQPGRENVVVTVSAGVARLLPGETVSELISRADQALYRSKNHGRNQVQRAA